MAKKQSIIYFCQNCGEEFIQWEGRCRNCGTWNSLKEFQIKSTQPIDSQTKGDAQALTSLNQIALTTNFRVQTGLKEFDRVLGGGIVPGSVILIGGDPGIGKSTLLLQIAARLEESKSKKSGINNKVLYISGEESLAQIKIRAARVSVERSPVAVLNETSLPNILETISVNAPTLVVIDSIQTLYHPDFPSTPGSIVQVRECSLRLQQLAKKGNITIILVGHITKEGTVAGPKTLEHLVDVVLYLEGEKYHNFRILRGVKNRFGDVSESGLFEMKRNGIEEITNPSALFLAEKIQAPGSVISVTLEGRRPILVEIQALVKKTHFGYPKRAASGFDINRLQLLLAVLEKRAGINFENSDVYVNIISGLKIKEPAIDLAIMTALASAKIGTVLDEKLVIWGEVGLSGEIRKVIAEDKRNKEVKRLGYQPSIKGKTIVNFFKNYGLLD